MSMNLLRRIINRVWWGEGWARDEEPYVELDIVKAIIGPNVQGVLMAASGATIRVGDPLVCGPDGRVYPGERHESIGTALEDFEYSASDGAWCGKAIL